MKKLLSIALVLMLLLSLGVPALAEDGSPAAVLSPQNLTVDGEAKDVEKYNIGGYNYFKLRDIAFLLNGTGSQFSLDWDAAARTVSITTGAPYAPDGSELVIGEDRSATAVKSGQSILIDGTERADLAAYNLGGNNFFRLVDLAGALNFTAEYDPETNTAVVTTAPAGPDLSAEGVYAAMDALAKDYPTGTPWDNSNYYAWHGGVFSGGYGCAGFAFMLSDAAFGDLPARRVEAAFDGIRAGDIIRMDGDTHSVIVLQVHIDGVVIAEGNYNGGVNWGRFLTADQVNAADYILTRYPE